MRRRVQALLVRLDKVELEHHIPPTPFASQYQSFALPAPVVLGIDTKYSAALQPQPAPLRSTVTLSVLLTRSNILKSAGSEDECVFAALRSR